MSTLVTRAGKGSPLTNNEVDANFNNLNNTKYESGDDASFGTLDVTDLASLDGGIDVNTSSFTVDPTGNITGVNLTTTGNYTASITTAVIASGNTQGDAVLLSKTYNIITGGTANQGVRLPPAVAGLLYTVINTTPYTIRIYPATNGTINSGSTNAHIDLIANATSQLVGTGNTNWKSIITGSTISIYDSAGVQLN